MLKEWNYLIIFYWYAAFLFQSSLIIFYLLLEFSLYIFVWHIAVLVFSCIFFYIFILCRGIYKIGYHVWTTKKHIEWRIIPRLYYFTCNIAFPNPHLILLYVILHPCYSSSSCFYCHSPDFQCWLPLSQGQAPCELDIH